MSRIESNETLLGVGPVEASAKSSRSSAKLPVPILEATASHDAVVVLCR